MERLRYERFDFHYDEAMTDEQRERIRKGIAGYAREQAILLRLLRMKGSFTENEFDKWLKFREYRRPRFYPRCVTGDTVILGLGQNGGNQWATWLDLLQHMMALDMLDATTENGIVIYKRRDISSNTERK